MDRRTFVARGAALATGTLAGCLGGFRPGSTPTPTGTPSPSGPIPAEQIDFRVGSRRCGEGQNVAQVDFQSATVSITGTIGGRDTCETATLDSVRRDGDRLIVRVVTVTAQTDTSACAQCLTDIEYTCRVETESDWPAQVTVLHGQGPDETTAADVTR